MGGNGTFLYVEGDPECLFVHLGSLIIKVILIIFIINNLSFFEYYNIL